MRLEIELFDLKLSAFYTEHTNVLINSDQSLMLHSVQKLLNIHQYKELGLHILMGIIT